MRAWIAVALGLAWALPAPGAVREVPGSYPTIGAALSAAGPGDIVRVAAGVFAPSTNGEMYPLVVNADGITLEGAGMGLAVLDAEGTSRVINWEAASGGRVTGFTIRGGLAATGGGLRIGNGNPEIDHNLFLDNGASFRAAAIYVIRQTAPVATPWIHHNVVWDSYDSTPEDAVDSHGVIHEVMAAGIFEHNLLGRTDGNGLLTSSGAAPVVRHNLFIENGSPLPAPRGRGICWLSDAPAVIYHNLFHANALAAVLWPAAGGNFSGTGANGVSAVDAVFGNVDGDPLLADPDGLDFALTAGSPAIDAGDPTLPFDPDGTVADLGPFHYDQGDPTASPVLDGAGAGELTAGPNPFRASTALRLAGIPRVAGAPVRIVDSAGRQVRVLRAAEGASEVVWDGRDDAGRPVASGVYLFVVHSPSGPRSLPIVRLR